MSKTILVVTVCLVLGAVLGFAATSLEFKTSGSHFVAYQSNTAPAMESAPAGSGKVVVVNGASFDFGVMDQFSTGRHTFHVKNAGDDTLTISLVQTSCTCASTDMAVGEPVVLEPGEEKAVSLEWELKSFARNFRQSATLRTSDPDREQVRLVVEGRISNKLGLVPSSIVFPNLSGNSESRDLLRVYAYEHDDLKCLEVRQGSPELEPFFDIEVTPMDAVLVADEEDCKSGLLVRVTAKPGIPLGPFRQQVQLVTNAENTTMHFDIEGNVVGDISVWTREKFSKREQLLDLGLIKRGRPRRAELQIIVKGEYMKGTHISVDEGATVPAGILRATVGEPVNMGKMARRFPLTIEIDTGNRFVSRLARGDEDNYARVVLKTTHPKAPEFVVRVAFATGG